MNVSHESAERYRETGDSRYLNVSTLLCFKTNHKTDDSVFFFMSIIPSADYLEEVDFDLSQNNYFQRDSLFDGQVFYHDLSLSFVNGWEYVDGVVTNYLYMDDLQTPKTRSRGEMTCYEAWNVIAKDYYYQSNGGHPVYNFTRYTFTSDYFCVNNVDGDQPAIWWIAPDEVPGGGGGYNPLSLELRKIMKSGSLTNTQTVLLNKALD